MPSRRSSSVWTRLLLASAAPLLLAPLAVGCSSAASEETTGQSSASALNATDLAGLALANVGGRACGTNSLGGSAFYSSCTGNGGQPEYWCSDFVKWIWANRGIDVSGLSAAAGSFYTYGQHHGTLSNTPSVGAAVVFDYQGGGVADHVAIVTAVLPDGRIETVSGDWNGQDGSQAHFASTASVVANRPAYGSAVGSTPGIIGMTISGYITPAGGVVPGGGVPGPVAGDCSVHADHKLYCNQTDGAMHGNPTSGSPVVNRLRTAYSWFDCWGTGDLHAGGNTTWYHTLGDDNGNWGWVPGVALSTPDSFDANPTAQGLPHCQ
jgi:surface antigen